MTRIGNQPRNTTFYRAAEQAEEKKASTDSGKKSSNQPSSSAGRDQINLKGQATLRGITRVVTDRIDLGQKGDIKDPSPLIPEELDPGKAGDMGKIDTGDIAKEKPGKGMAPNLEDGPPSGGDPERPGVNLPGMKPNDPGFGRGAGGGGFTPDPLGSGRGEGRSPGQQGQEGISTELDDLEKGAATVVLVAGTVATAKSAIGAAVVTSVTAPVVAAVGAAFGSGVVIGRVATAVGEWLSSFWGNNEGDQTSAEERTEWEAGQAENTEGSSGTDGGTEGSGGTDGGTDGSSGTDGGTEGSSGTDGSDGTEPSGTEGSDGTEPDDRRDPDWVPLPPKEVFEARHNDEMGKPDNTVINPGAGEEPDENGGSGSPIPGLADPFGVDPLPAVDLPNRTAGDIPDTGDIDWGEDGVPEVPEQDGTGPSDGGGVAD